MKNMLSKYQKKNYEEIILQYHEVECPYCHGYFQIDFSLCTFEPDKLTPRDWVVVYCPYCGKKTRHFW